MKEISDLQPSNLPLWDGALDLISHSIAERLYWKHGVCAQSILARAILGSILLIILTKGIFEIGLRHILLDGSSSQVVDRNITRYSTSNQMNGNTLVVLDGKGRTLQISLIDHGIQCYTLAYFFKGKRNCTSTYSASAKVHGSDNET